MAKKYEIGRYTAAIVLLLQALVWAQPSVSDQMPAPGSLNVSENSALQLTFDEGVSAGEGRIVIWKSDTRSVFESIRVDSSNVLIDSVIYDFDSTSEGFTVNQGSEWTNEQFFSNNGAIKQVLADGEKITRDEPNWNAVDWSGYDSLIVWVYSEDVTSSDSVYFELNTGGWCPFNSQGAKLIPGEWARLAVSLLGDACSDPTQVRQISIRFNSEDAGEKTLYLDRISLKRSASRKVTIFPSQPFDSATTYYVMIPETAFLGETSVEYFPGYSEPSNWRFSTGDNIVAGPDNYLWDPSSAAGIQAGSGLWAGENWSAKGADGTSPFSWPDSNSSAEFLAEGGGTITISGTVNADSLLFSGADYVLDGGTLNITGENASIITNSNGEITSSLLSDQPLYKKGDAQLTLSGAVTHQLNQFHLLAGKTVVESDTILITGSDANRVSMSVAGELDVTGGVIVVDDGNVVFGDGTAALAELSGGITADSMIIGNGANAAVTITDGVHTYSGVLNRSGSGQAVLTMNGGHLYSPLIGTNSNGESSSFSINLSGDNTILETGRIFLSLGEDALLTEDAHVLELIIDGGELRVSSDPGPLLDGQNGLLTAAIGAGGAKINTATSNTSIQVPLISSGAGVDGGLTKIGSGILTLEAQNTYTGPTTIDAGTLQLGISEALPHGIDAGNVAVSGILDLNGNLDTINGFSGEGTVTNSSEDPATLVVGANDAGSVFGGVVEDGAGALSLVKIGSGKITLAGDNTFSLGLALREGIVQLGDGGESGSVSGDIVNTGTLVFNRSDSVTYTGNVSGTGELHQDGEGLVTLGGTNTYSGGTFVNGGSLKIESNTALGAEEVSLQTGARQLILGGGVNMENNIVIDSGVGLGADGGVIHTSGADTLSGSVSILHAASSDVHFSGEGETNSLVISGVIAAPSDVPVSSRHDNLLLSGGGTYKQLRILAGKTSLGADSGVSATSVVELAGAADAVLDLNGFNQVLAGIVSSGEGVATVTNTGETASVLSLNVNDTAFTYGGAITGNLSMEKSGTGTLVLGGVNTYTGTTAIDEGTLRVEGSIGEESSLAVAKGAVLDIAGTVSGTVTVADSGVLSCDSEEGANVTIGNLELQENSILNITIGATCDTIVVEGDLVVDGIMNVEMGPNYETGRHTIMTCAGTLTNNTIRIADEPEELQYDIYVTENEVQLEVTQRIITPVQNPLVVKATRIRDRVVQLTISGIAGIPSEETVYSPWADSVGIWYRPGSFYETPDTAAQNLLTYYLPSMQFTGSDISDTFVTTVVIPSAGGSESNIYYFSGTMFWHNPDSIPPFDLSRGDSVRVTTRTIQNPLTFSSTYDDERDQVILTVDSISKLPTHTKRIGLWYGFDEQPDFESESETKWYSAEDFRAFGDAYHDSIADERFGAVPRFYYASVLEDTSGSRSDVKTGAQTLGIDVPENPLSLNCTTTGPQTVILEWGSEPFANDSVRIWYSIDSIGASHSLTEGDLYKVIYPPRNQDTDTIHTLLPLTTYFFGLQRFENGLWSDITEQSRAKATMPGGSGSKVGNVVLLDSIKYDDQTHVLTVYWKIDTTQMSQEEFGEYDLMIGAEYAFDGYPEIPGPNTKVSSVTGLEDSITLEFREGIIFDTLCYVSLYLKAADDVFGPSTEKSRATFRTPSYSTQDVYLFGDGKLEASVFNNKILFKRGTEDFGNTFTVKFYEPDAALMDGFVPAGLAFEFDDPVQTPEYYVGIRYDSIPQGYAAQKLRLYRVVDDKLLVEHDSYVQDGVVWVKTNENKPPFVLLADTLKPQVEFSMSDTASAMDANGEKHWQPFSISDNCANVKFGLRASAGDKWFDYEKDSILVGTSGFVNTYIPKSGNASEAYGFRALLIVSDGAHVDTINISRRVLSDNIGEVPTPLTPAWRPLAVRGSLTVDSMAGVLDELVNEENNKWEYDTYRFRLFRYMGTQMPATNDKGWLEYADSVKQHFTLVPGRLFWLKTKEQQIIKLGEGKTTSLKDTFEIRLTPGQWTDFASPFQFDVPLNAILSATGTDVDSIQLYHWYRSEEEQHYRAAELYISSIEDLKASAGEKVLFGKVNEYGYTAYNPLDRPITLRIPPIPNVAGAPDSPKKAAFAKAHHSQWGVWFDWREENQSSSRKIRCLVDNSMASAQRVYALAPSFASVGAGVVDTMSKTLGGHIITPHSDQQGYSWQVVLYNQGNVSKNIAYNLGNLSSLPPEMEARIWDPEKQTFEKPDENGLRETLEPSSEKTKWLVVGTRAYMHDFKQIVPGARLAFTGCYPNPFAGRLSIRYSVPQNEIKQVAFTIYDVRGRLIWKQKIDQPRPGNKIFVWNGRSVDNGRVAAGQYILRMTAVTMKGKRKVVGEQRIAYLPR